MFGWVDMLDVGKPQALQVPSLNSPLLLSLDAPHCMFESLLSICLVHVPCMRARACVCAWVRACVLRLLAVGKITFCTWHHETEHALVYRLLTSRSRPTLKSFCLILRRSTGPPMHTCLRLVACECPYKQHHGQGRDNAWPAGVW